ncbi:MAG: helix-turn-helix transcriptional regulator [Deferribacterales bacterium]
MYNETIIYEKSGPAVRTVIRARNIDFIREAHAHPECELILNIKGNVSCLINNTLWIIPQQSALFIPANVIHQTKSTANTEYCLIFINPERIKLAETCTFFRISSLLREMVLHMSKMPKNYYENSGDLMFSNALLHTLEQLPVAGYSMPIPYSEKLSIIADTLTINPADRTTLLQWAKKMGMSERNLARLVIKETGLTFGHWRQQFQITTALRKLEAGNSIQQIAWDLGYESVTAFIAMFKKNFGKPPKKYLAEINTGQ